MKHIENYSGIEDNKIITSHSYNKMGTIIEDTNDIIYAKLQAFNIGNKIQTKYYVLTANGNLFDPLGTDSHREKNIRKELKLTSKTTFDFYLSYLKSRNQIFLRRAERNFING